MIQKIKNLAAGDAAQFVRLPDYCLCRRGRDYGSGKGYRSAGWIVWDYSVSGHGKILAKGKEGESLKTVKARAIAALNEPNTLVKIDSFESSIILQALKHYAHILFRNRNFQKFTSPRDYLNDLGIIRETLCLIRRVELLRERDEPSAWETNIPKTWEELKAQRRQRRTQLGSEQGKI